MRLLISLAWLGPLALWGAPLPQPAVLQYAILSGEPGAWPKILSSIGLQPGGPVSPVLVVRSDGRASPDWSARVENGAFLIAEGESPVAEMFGFRPSRESVRVASVEDIHAPKLPIVWQRALELPRFELPKDARVFAKDRWSSAPLLAGIVRGRGAVLWTAVSPGERGYERLPYILHALADLGLPPPLRSTRLWAFFDSSYRLRVDLDYFADRWWNMGIGALHVAAWHFFDPQPERDAYLRRLIEACHRKGVLVYAWLELPHVSERFWNDHPQWREKTALLEDAQLDWRKLMNLANPDCRAAAWKGVRELLSRFDWDGVNLAELYFESLEGMANPSRFTPLNEDVRAEFRRTGGFDPIELFRGRGDAPSRRAFLDYRAGLARRIEEQWLSDLESLRGARPELDIVLTHVDDRFDTRMKDAIGVDAGRVLPLLDRHSFTFLVEDPATVWHLGPERYAEIARRYAPLTPQPEKLAIDINIVERYQDVYPTRQQTGTELFQLVHQAAQSFPRVALYFENSILRPDTGLLSSAAAVVTRVERIGPKLVIDSRFGVGVPWSGPALVDGSAWPVADDRTVWLPAGGHTLEPGGSSGATPLRVLRFNGELRSARSAGAVELSYRSSGRALAVLDRVPTSLAIDGVARPIQLTGPSTLALPRGQHLVTIRAE